MRMSKAGLAVTLAGTALLAAACGGSSPTAAGSRLYRQELTRVPPSFRTADPLGSSPERKGLSGREEQEILS